jgi:hypothetical protein
LVKRPLPVLGPKAFSTVKSSSLVTKF